MPDVSQEGQDVGIRIDIPVGVFSPLGDSLGTLQVFGSPFSTRAFFSDLSRPLSFELVLEHDDVEPKVLRREDWSESEVIELIHPKVGSVRAKLVVFDECGNLLVTALAGHR